MLPFDEEFQTGEAKITQVRLAVILANSTRLDLTEEHVMLGGFIRDTSTTVDGAFTIGAAVTSKVTIMLDNSDQSLSGYDFRGAVITASLGGESSPDVFQLLQVGIYTVDEYTYDGSVITLTAYDDFHKFDVACSKTSVTFPITLQNLVLKACEVAGVTLSNSSIPNGSYSITKRPEQWDTMTWHDVVSYCAQIACCYARILPNGRLYLAWYNTSVFNAAQLDGGTFDTETTPYSDGGIADGGDFDYTDTTVIDGGSFGDRENVHILGSVFDLTVNTDDVLITGVTVSLDPTNNINATDDTDTYEKTLGTAGYIIRIENNPLIETTANADAVCSYIYNFVVGMRFRPLDASILENPAVEAGDVALVIDRLNNTYTCFLSHVSYTTGAATSISCDAESSMQNLKARYSEAQKTRALAQRTFEKTITDAEAAMSTIMTALATTMGLYQYTESDGQGGTIYVYGNKNTLAASNIRWKFSAGAMMVSSDYGRTWNAAISADGIAVLQEIYAVKVNADNILAGSITIGGTSGNKNGSLIIKDASGNVIGTFNKDGISVKGNIQSGSSIAGATVSGTNINGGEIKGSSLSGTNINAAQIKINPRDSDYSQVGGYIGLWIYSASYDGVLVQSLNSSGYNCIEDYTMDSSGKNYRGLKINGGSLQIGRGIRGSLPYNALTFNSRMKLEYDMNAYCNNHIDQLTCNFETYDHSPQYGNMIFHVGFINNGQYYPSIYFNDLYAFQLVCFGTKSRAVDTLYGTRLAYCYEMPSPMFGDIGSATIGEDGSVLVDIDVIFRDYIYANCEYYVFLQNEGKGESYISEKTTTYFVISGTPGLKVAWEIKAKQVDAYWKRSEEMSQDVNNGEKNEPDYEKEAQEDVMKYLNINNYEEVTT